MVDGEAMAEMVAKLGVAPQVAPGGSAANTVFALARLGVPSAFLGKLGEDTTAEEYRAAFTALGGDNDRFKQTGAAATARCLSLVTPDSERTLRTDLGAAMLMAPEDISLEDFEGYTHAHVEGYLLFNPALAEAALGTAKEAGCTVSVDLGSFEVVNAAGDSLPGLLEKYVDAVFANEDEAEAFCGSSDPLVALDALGALCRVAAVKVGPAGAHLMENGETCFVPANKVDQPLDTTGAGDLWAAGFLYGHLGGCSAETSGKMGAILGAEIVQVLGAKLDDAAWTRVEKAFAALA